MKSMMICFAFVVWAFGSIRFLPKNKFGRCGRWNNVLWLLIWRTGLRKYK